MLRRSRWLTASVLGGLGAIGAGPVWAAWAADSSVPITDGSFGVPAGPVHAGDTVTWVNDDDRPHDVSGVDGPAGFVSPLLEPGSSWSFTFTDPGTYTYVCTLHEGMAGAITVEDHAAAAPAPAAADPEPPAAPPVAVEEATPAAPPAAPPSPAPAAPPIAATPAEVAAPAAASAPGRSHLVVDLRLLGAALLTAVVAAALLGSNPRGRMTNP